MSTLLAVSLGLTSAQLSPASPSISLPSQPVTRLPNSTWEDTLTHAETFGKELEKIDKTITTIILAAIKIFALLFSLVLIQRLLILIFSRTPDLIIENFINASSDTSLDNVLPGLAQLARQELIRDIKGVRQRVKDHIQGFGPESFHQSNNAPLPEAASDQRLTNLISSIKEFAPEQLSPVFQFINILFPPFGTKVTCFLQSRGNSPSQIGFTVEITDIQGKLAPKLYTIWEPLDKKLENLQNAPSQPSLKDRYISLLGATSRWIALELSRKEMLSHIPFGQNHKRYQGQVHNFFGVLNHACITQGNFFDQLAIEDLQQAIEFCPKWYQPYENLADIYTDQGQKSENQAAITLYRQAIFQYDTALERAPDLIKRRIRLGKAIAQLRLKEPSFTEQAKYEIQIVRVGWNATSEQDDRILYNFAVWYALAAQYNVVLATKAVVIARRYLAYGLARNDRFWDWSTKDPDLKLISDGLEIFQLELRSKLRKVPKLRRLLDQDFVNMIDEILEKAAWL